MKKTVNYYVATLKGGHVGQKYYIEFTKAIKAYSKKEAADKCKKLPRAKKGQADMIISIDEISYDEYVELMKEENENPYFLCKNIQQQRSKMSEIKYEIKLDPLYTDRDIERKKRKELGSANNKRRYANRYEDTYYDWKSELAELVVA